ncbi:SNF2-related protein [Zobellella iuensis]|uniref:DEAD/DEAH box helicase family protein n=1 Tax=Zobellella iuensis TaxID=2803811 RepID=A0ABS1QPQ9_9GAMM|nr:SNF2-related protein [Zobellella iuensis]MBL1376471.1 DEAD/DEAH box helicase family protein [Zobellella iuensis]
MTSSITDYHAKYFAFELTRQRRGGDVGRLGNSLFDASVDLNPHQIDAALFALQNPLVKGVVLADEVGLGKTIEASLVMAQLWAERKRHIVVICPAALRKQWSNELAEKFHLPTQVLDNKTWKTLRNQGIPDPFSHPVISIFSFQFAKRMEQQLRQIPWDLVVIDEAHKLRNAHQDSNIIGNCIRETFAGCKKLLLTATPLQNSLLELFGLSTIIDENLFGDKASFRQQYMRSDSDLIGLKSRLGEFVHRTLRKQVLEYVPYTERKAYTYEFEPSEDEIRLYYLVSAYLQRPDTYGVPLQQRHLVTLVVRKLLASSTAAVRKTLDSLLKRLKKLEAQDSLTALRDDSWPEDLLDDDFDDELLEAAEEFTDYDNTVPTITLDPDKLRGEIAELEQYRELAGRIHEDAKSSSLLIALEQGLEKMAMRGAGRKAVIFTESCRTQEYLASHLERHGYAGKVALFSGSNNAPGTNTIYQHWLEQHQGTDRVTGSRAVDVRTALIDHFRSDAEILIATEAAAEGVNLQFCSLVINYDLPWNPQRIEQRIGRCHRYGQKHDVVVINFLNQRNEADKRVLELLSHKFQLFDGLFGASDDVLGSIESGLDIEKRIVAIYNECREPAEIQAAFDQLQKELEEDIARRMDETREKLFQHFDANIHDKLKLTHEEAQQQLDQMSRMFWNLSQHVLAPCASFTPASLSFQLEQPPAGLSVPVGLYQLVSKNKQLAPMEQAHKYRLGHPLGEWVLDTGRRLDTAPAMVEFHLSDFSKKLSSLETLHGQAGWLELNQLQLSSFQNEEHLVFTAFTDQGHMLDAEQCADLFLLNARPLPLAEAMPPDSLEQNAKRQLDAKLSKLLDENNEYFKRERDKLEAWAEDQMRSAQKQLEDTRVELQQAKKLSRQANTIEEQKEAQEAIKRLERKQRQQRQEIFNVEDAIEARRDAHIDALEQQMHQKSSTQRLFTLRWRLV